MVALALYQPDIPQNLGTILRLSACLAVPVHVIEPCGFPLDDRKMRRAGMDYLDAAIWQRHISWESFFDDITCRKQRLVLLSTRSKQPYTSFAFADNDILLLGRESAGVPESIHNQCPHSITIPMQANQRSLNIAIAAAIVTGEALRQTRWHS